MANLDRWCFAWAPERTTPLGAEKAACLRETMWTKGDTITVSFLDGDEGVQKKVRKYAEQWTARDMADLNLEFRTDKTDTMIRISFRHPGSWSALGGTCKRITDKSAPTMNYGWITPATPNVEVRRVVLHEFGHALGLIHEHQNPKDNPIVWNPRAVIADLSGPPNNWTVEQILDNVLQPYADAAVKATPFDPDSIMMYLVPERWTANGVSTELNSQISKQDADLIREVYG